MACHPSQFPDHVDDIAFRTNGGLDEHLRLGNAFGPATYPLQQGARPGSPFFPLHPDSVETSVENGIRSLDGYGVSQCPDAHSSITSIAVCSPFKMFAPVTLLPHHPDLVRREPVQGMRAAPESHPGPGQR